MIKIRQLEYKDIPFMMEWMHDEENKVIFQNNFMTITEKEAKQFIDKSFNNENVNFAIVDDSNDEYLGTISLKNIDYKNKNAEYAISTRKKSRGTGINKVATSLILKYAFEELKLKRVYLNVLSSNGRAKNFYVKCGFKYEGTFKKHLFITNQLQDLEWYGMVL